MRRNLESGIASVFLSGLTMLSIFSFVASEELQTLQQSSALADRSRSSIITVQNLYRALLSAESGQRGYLLTSGPEYLDAYENDVVATRIALSQLSQNRELILETPSDLHRLYELCDARLTVLQHTVDLETAHRHNDAIAVVRSGVGRRLMQQSLAIIDALVVGERTRLGEESASISKTRLSLERIFRVGEIVLGLFFAAAFYIIQRTLKARARDAESLRSSEVLLRATERKLLDIVDNVPALISEYDLDHRCVFISEELIRTYLMDPSTVIGKTQMQVRGEAAFAEVRHHLEAVLTGEPRRFEMAVQVNGTDRHIYQTLIPKRDLAGAVCGYYSMTIDITATKAAEIALAESKKRLQAVADNVPALIAYVDRDEVYRFVNERYATIFSRHHESIVGGTMADLLGPRAKSVLQPHITDVLLGVPQKFDVEGQGLGLSGDFHTEYLPDFDQDGSVCGFYIQVVDITERRRNEMELRRQQHMLRSIADNLPISISYTDRDGVVRFANNTCAEWFNMRVEDIVDRPLVDVLGPEAYASRLPAIQSTYQGTRIEFEAAMESPSGPRLLQIIYIPEKAPDGTVSGIFVLRIDITERKAVEHKLDLLARVDPLTGLSNRRQFDEKLRDHLLRVRRTPSRFALLYLDIDCFKSINDTHGHAAGDAVLVEFGARLKGSIRSTDVVARLAGDEFVVLLTELRTPAEASLVAEKINRAVRADLVIPHRILNITTSIGIAYAAQPETTAKDLFAFADRALYKTKEAGRNGSFLVECNVIEMPTQRKNAS